MAKRFKKAFLERLFESANIVDVISSDRKVIRRGSDSYVCVCPFHDDKSPSLSITPSKGLYHCFACSASGNSYSYLKNRYNLSFSETVEKLAAITGMSLEFEESSYSPDQVKAEQERQQRLEQDRAVMNKVAELYQQMLQDTPQAVNYLNSRNISTEMVELYRIGYAPGNNFVRHFLENNPAYFGITKEAAKQSLLNIDILRIKEGQLTSYDTYSQRIMFPIVNERSGQILGFGGRTIVDHPAKYINPSNESSLYNKSAEVYGLYQADYMHKKLKQKLERLILVEGYLDVISLSQFGLYQGVAASGTAIQPQQVRKIFNFCKNLAVCFDGDNAGYQAAYKSLAAILSTIDDEKNVTFSFLPKPEDPDSFLKKFGVEAFEKFISQGQDLIAYIIEHEYEACKINGVFTPQSEREFRRLITQHYSYLLRPQRPEQTKDYRRALIRSLAHKLQQAVADVSFEIETDAEVEYQRREEEKKREREWEAKQQASTRPTYTHRGENSSFQRKQYPANTNYSTRQNSSNPNYSRNSNQQQTSYPQNHYQQSTIQNKFRGNNEQQGTAQRFTANGLLASAFNNGTQTNSSSGFNWGATNQNQVATTVAQNNQNPEQPENPISVQQADDSGIATEFQQEMDAYYAQFEAMPPEPDYAWQESQVDYYQPAEYQTATTAPQVANSSQQTLNTNSATSRSRSSGYATQPSSTPFGTRSTYNRKGKKNEPKVRDLNGVSLSTTGKETTAAARILQSLKQRENVISEEQQAEKKRVSYLASQLQNKEVKNSTPENLSNSVVNPPVGFGIPLSEIATSNLTQLNSSAEQLNASDNSATPTDSNPVVDQLSLAERLAQHEAELADRQTNFAISLKQNTRTNYDSFIFHGVRFDLTLLYGEQLARQYPARNIMAYHTSLINAENALSKLLILAYHFPADLQQYRLLDLNFDIELEVFQLTLKLGRFIRDVWGQLSAQSQASLEQRLIQYQQLFEENFYPQNRSTIEKFLTLEQIQYSEIRKQEVSFSLLIQIYVKLVFTSLDLVQNYLTIFQKDFNSVINELRFVKFYKKYLTLQIKPANNRNLLSKNLDKTENELYTEYLITYQQRRYRRYFYQISLTNPATEVPDLYTELKAELAESAATKNKSRPK